MRLLIVTPLYPPEIGGPSYYAAGLEEALRQNGHDTEVSHYGLLKRFPTGIRHVLYALILAPKMIWADAVIALDTFSVGLPAVVVGRILCVPIIVRVGGDFLWEQYTERTGEMIPLPTFYKEHRNFTRKEKMIFDLTSFVLAHSVVVFSTDWLRDIWHDVYRFDKTSAHVIENAIEKRLDSIPPKRKDFLFCTRDIVLKNKQKFREAFDKAKESCPDIELVEEIVPREELIEKMKRAYAVVLPSLSEVSPNYILDAVRLGKPFILTKYSGYADQFGKYGLLVDPLDVEDMKQKIMELADEDTYKRITEQITEFITLRTYRDIAGEFIDLVEPAQRDGVRVLAIGSDRSLFTADSPAVPRQKKYGELLDELNIIVFTKRSHGAHDMNIAENVHVYPTNSLSRWLYVFDAIRIGKHIDTDVLTAQDPFESGLVGAYLSRKRRLPLNIQVHVDLFTPEFIRSHILNVLRRFIAPFVLRRASNIRVVSERIRHSIEKYKRKNATIHTLPIFVDIGKYGDISHTKHPRFDPAFLVVARLEPEKRVLLAIEALAHVCKNGNTDAGLTIVGTGNEKNTLQTHAQRLGVSEQVEFAGSVSDVESYYKTADAVLVTSSYEGYGMVIAEALAAGIPVISTDVGVAQESGAIIAEDGSFKNAVLKWVKNGPKGAVLKAYPYKNEQEYVEKYCSILTSLKKNDHSANVESGYNVSL